MSGGAFVSDQLVPIKHAKFEFVWEGKQAVIKYVKTSNNVCFGCVLDVGKLLAGPKFKGIRVAVLRYNEQLQFKCEERLAEAVSKVFLHNSIHFIIFHHIS